MRNTWAKHHEPPSRHPAGSAARQRDFRHINAENRAAALRTVARLQEIFHLLATQPLMGESRDDFGKNVRLFTVGNYVIFFRPANNTVEILGVVHGARDLKAACRLPDK
jgi:toxin ParE1/3/4